MGQISTFYPNPGPSQAEKFCKEEIRMRNLKRALSLTLASVMLLGMMVVGTSAAAGYDDVKETDNVEAIEVLQAVEVMVGDDRGFGPDRPVSRAEMAVVMGKLLNLDYNYYVATCPFADVSGNYDWAKGWVGACAANGIVSGRGDGIYDPAATVTAVEAASMMMRALGYFRYQNDYSDGFMVSTVRLGTKIGIFEGVGTDAATPMTRNQVAQMALNALKSGMVEPDGNTIDLTTPDGTVFTGKVNYVNVTSDKPFARAIKSTQATSVGSTNLGTIVELGEQLYDGKLELRENDNDVFGRPARTWKFNSADIGTYAKKELIVKTYHEKVTGRTVYDELGQSTIRDNALESYLNGHETNIGKVQLVRANNNGLVDTSNGSAETTGRGVLTEIYLDHDLDVITIVSIDTYLAQVNSDYNENSETVSLSVYDAFSPRTKLVDLEDVPGIVDLKKDQWVLVNWADESTAEVNKRVVVISEPEILSDVKATQFSRSEDENKGNYNDDPTGERVTSIVVDGTEYKNNRQAYYEEGTLYDYQQDYLVNKTYDLYLDAYGNFIGAALHSGADQYVFIAGYDRPQSSIGVRTADAAAIFPDGSMEVIKVNVKNTNDNIEDYLEDNRTANYANTSDTPLNCKPINTTNIAKLDARWDNNAWKYWSWSENDGVAGQYQENMWYSYTEVDGVYTLTPAKGWTLDMNTASDPTEIVINCSNVRLTHDGDADGFHMGTGRSYSEDESAFITVELGDTDAGADTGVTEVTGTYTGIQNVNLVYKTNQWVNAVYNAKNGYIVAAIVLGEAEGVVDNYAFIRSGVFNEKYDEATKTHYWDFKCILNGELVTKTIKSKFDSTVRQLDENTVQELVLDADGYVVRIKDLDDTDPGSDDEIYNNYDYINNTNTTGNNTINLDDYDVYDIVINSGFPNATATGVNFQMGDAYCIDLALQNNTLHYDRDVKDVGLHFVNNAKAVVRQYVNNDWTWQSYSSVAQAFNTLTDADNDTTNNATNLKQFNGRIVAVLNSRGEAEWVFFWDYTRANTITNGYSVTFTGDTAKVDVTNITGIAKGETVTFTVPAKNGCTVTNVQIAGGAVLTPDANGVYTINRVNSNLSVRITATGTPVTPANIAFTWNQPANAVIFGVGNYANGTASAQVNAGYLNFSIDWGTVANPGRVVTLDGVTLTESSTQGSIYNYSAVVTATDHAMVIGGVVAASYNLTIPNDWKVKWAAGAGWDASNGDGTDVTSTGTAISVPEGASLTVTVAVADQSDNCYRYITGLPEAQQMQASVTNALSLTMPAGAVTISGTKYHKIDTTLVLTAKTGTGAPTMNDSTLGATVAAATGADSKTVNGALYVKEGDKLAVTFTLTTTGGGTAYTADLFAYVSSPAGTTNDFGTNAAAVKVVDTGAVANLGTTNTITVPGTAKDVDDITFTYGNQAALNA